MKKGGEEGVKNVQIRTEKKKNDQIMKFKSKLIF